MTDDQRLTLKAGATAFVGLLDGLLALGPWLDQVLQEAGEVDGLDDFDPKLLEWPEGNASVRGAAYQASGGVNQLVITGELETVSDELHVLLRRLGASS